MPRHARIVLPDHVYHVTNRGNNRDRVFQEGEDFRKYLEILTRYKSKEGFLLYHWVLMNNHVHLLLGIPEKDSLAKVMQGINLSYTLWFNRRYRRVGHLWQGRFKSFPVENDNYLLACGRYIEKNPLRAGIVASPGEYPWSIFQAHADGLSDGITDRHELFSGQFGSVAPESYKAFVCENRERKEQELREKMSEGVIGSSTFQESIRQGAVAARRPKRGRPKKMKAKVFTLFLIICHAIAIIASAMDIPLLKVSEEYPAEERELNMCSLGCAMGWDVEASSTLPPQGTYNYVAQNVSDFSLDTAWAEGANGQGIGEYILFKFTKDHFQKANIGEKINWNGFIVVNGYARNPAAWRENSRVKRMLIEHNKNLLYQVELKDTENIQEIHFNPIFLKPGDVVKVKILEVYPGEKYQDTALTELIPLGAH